MSVVIRLENLGKRYRLGDINRRMLYEDMQRLWARMCGRKDSLALVGGPSKGSPAHPSQKQRMRRRSGRCEKRQISRFATVKPPGYHRTRNGSGKSTMLKISFQNHRNSDRKGVP